MFNSWCLPGSVGCEGRLQNTSILLPAWAPSGAGHFAWALVMMGCCSLSPEQPTVGHEQSCSEPASSLYWGSNWAEENEKHMDWKSHKLNNEISSRRNEFGPISSIMPSCFTSPQRSIVKIGSLGTIRTWQSLQTLPNVSSKLPTPQSSNWNKNLSWLECEIEGKTL